MTMTRKQLKATRRHKAIAKRRNIKTNNLSDTKAHGLVLYNPHATSHTYRLYNI
ncbi:MAG: hypothetical protein IKG11_03135 [Atopobiaceae bacterium]|nr:hypothetical protein [Atopobiaceae bacterium]